ncbi:MULTISPECIES: LuxR C-terminal-related transcriptional regulator [Staphylococcus]|uniref:LuxR C-terminal-related transcriptional regulator n=1 Tax=Staphylococcus TaxID=1279 RepID=UPI000852ABA6|nr:MULTISPECIES: replication-associated family protein [Staphylococcus]MCZ4237756.1 replication-associated family protein [Staphylococcus equorum]OEK23356.1 replication-associated family protein [Staphylococcus saprophyticus]OEK65736.1 replication-associated family protein [Staphylococcus equorum]QKV12705.1 replication-associated family protein [Staphylococcus saprophyticus]
MKTVKEVSESLNVSKQTIHYHLKNLPSNLKVKKTGNKSLIDDSVIAYLESILNKKSTKESTNKSSSFDEKSTKESTNKKEPMKARHDSYIDKYIAHLESEIRQKNRQIDDLTIALKQEQSLNLNSQNILSHNDPTETDDLNTKEEIFETKTPDQSEQKQSIFSKLFKKK